MTCVWGLIKNQYEFVALRIIKYTHNWPKVYVRVCSYLSMYVLRIYVCYVCVCVYVCMCVCMCGLMYVCMYVLMYVCMYVCMYACMCVYVCMYFFY
jgi:hypothetical protein